MSYTPQVGDRVKITAPISATHAVIEEPKDFEDEYLVRFEDGDTPGLTGYVLADQIARADMPAGDIFDHVDDEGDALTVYTRPNDENEPVAFTVNADTEEKDERTVCLSRAGVTRLRLALKPYDEADATGFERLTAEDADGLADPDAYVVTEESFPLDVRRVAALKLAHDLYPAAAPGDLLAIVAFLVGGMDALDALAASAATAGGTA